MECTDTCPYCHYIEDGDFICTATKDNDDVVVIVGWKPFECVCPEKRRNK